MERRSSLNVAQISDSRKIIPVLPSTPTHLLALVNPARLPACLAPTPICWLKCGAPRSRCYHSKNTLPQVHFEDCSPQPSKHLLQVVQVLLHIARPDDNVVNVTSEEWQILENLIHATLKVGRSILQPKGDYQPFP